LALFSNQTTALLRKPPDHRIRSSVCNNSFPCSSPHRIFRSFLPLLFTFLCWTSNLPFHFSSHSPTLFPHQIQLSTLLPALESSLDLASTSQLSLTLLDRCMQCFERNRLIVFVCDRGNSLYSHHFHPSFLDSSLTVHFPFTCCGVLTQSVNEQRSASLDRSFEGQKARTRSDFFRKMHRSLLDVLRSPVQQWKFRLFMSSICHLGNSLAMKEGTFPRQRNKPSFASSPKRWIKPLHSFLFRPSTRLCSTLLMQATQQSITQSTDTLKFPLPTFPLSPLPPNPDNLIDYLNLYPNIFTRISMAV